MFSKVIVSLMLFQVLCADDYKNIKDHYLTKSQKTINNNQSAQLSEALKQSIMSRLLGGWNISDSSLNSQGKWQKGQGATWHFYPILNGHAIQDDWISPALNKPEPENGRQYGTNIRIFNPKKNQWEMAWASVKGQQVNTFTAVETKDKIIMSGFYNEKNTRITFFDIRKNNFSWKLEYQQDDGWLEVYRIKGKRIINFERTLSQNISST